MKKYSQTFLPTFQKISSEFGGSLLNGKRKSKRPISIKQPMLLTIKSDHLIFLKNLKDHKKLVHQYAKQLDIKIMAVSFNGNHVHIVFRVFFHQSYNAFIRALTSQMSAVAKIKKAFTVRPHTRFIAWGRHLKTALSYLNINNLEADGLPRPNARLIHRLLNGGFPSI